MTHIPAGGFIKMLDRAQLMSQPTLLYVTTPDKGTAKTIATALVEQHLAACVNILPQTQSIYRWNGVIEEADECVVLVKTTTERAISARDLIVEQHPAETPCVIALPIEGTGTHPAFANWIKAETTPLNK